MAFIDPRKREKLPLVGAHLYARSSNAHAQTCVNFYPEIIKVGEKQDIVLYPTPGTLFVTNAGLGPHRGAIVHSGNAYYVSGSELIKQTTADVFTSVGTLLTTTNRVSMASNGTFGNQLIIVDGTYGYTWDGATLTQIVDPQFPAKSCTTCVHGFLFCSNSK